MNKINHKGLTMVELLAVVVIIGILSSMSIIAYTKYINSSKREKQKQNEVTIENAAKIFLQNNQSYRPKNIGEFVAISVSELKENQYLKEDIINEKKESCMDKSFIYVYKVSENKYSYKTNIFCGDEEVNIENNNPDPVIENISFSNSEGLKNASINFILKGDSLKQVEIDSYNYSFSVSTDGTNYIEAYNSGSISGNGEKEIKVNNLLLKDYIDLTSVAKVRLDVLVRNSVGKSSEKSESFTFTDSQPPVCLSTKIEPKKEWLNHDDIFNEAAEKRVVRKITVTCDDQDGSGCLRTKFTKKWGAELTDSIEHYDFVIEDNMGLTTSCRKNVNVDIKYPVVSVVLKNKNNKVIVNKSSNGNSQLNINSGQNWFGGDNFESVVYNIHLSDDLYLYKYTWMPEENGDVQETIIEHNENSRINDLDINLYFTKEGKNKGVLNVYDKAGNVTTVTIIAWVDLTPPTCTIAGENDKWTKDDVTIRSTCYDEASGCEQLNYNTVVFNQTTLTSSMPAYTIRDKAGNTTNCPSKNASVYVDKTPPTCENVVTCTSGKDCASWLNHNDSLTITAKCSDGHSGCRTIKDADARFVYQNRNYNITNGGSSGVGNGITIYDKVGNSTICPADVTVKLDNEAPSIPSIVGYKCTSSSSCNDAYTFNTWTKYDVKTLASSTDKGGSGINYYQYYTEPIEGSTFNNQSGVLLPGSFSTLNQSAKIQYRTCDKAGNCSSYSPFKNVKIDKNPPDAPSIKAYKWNNTKKPTSTAGLTEYSSGWSNKKIYTKASSNDSGGSGIKYYSYNITGDSFTEGNGISIENDGTTTIKYKACDKAGNCSSYSSKKVQIDTVAPSKPTINVYKWKDKSTRPTNSTGLTAYSSGWSNKYLFSIASNSSDNTNGSGLSRYEYVCGSSSNNSSNNSIESNGEKTIKYRACDNAGNCSDYSTKNVKIDTVAPSVPTINTYKSNSSTTPSSVSGLYSYTSGSWTNTNVYAKPNSNDTGGSGIAKYLITTSGSTTSYTDALSSHYYLKREGTSTIKYKACDNAGNCSSYSSVKTIKIDKTSPTCKHNENYTEWTSENRDINWVCEDNLSGCVNNFILKKTVNESSWSWYYRGTIYDNAGNSYYCDDTADALVDKDPPFTPYLVNVENIQGIYVKEITCNNDAQEWNGYRECTVKLGKSSSYSGIDYEWNTSYNALDKHSGWDKFYLTYYCSGGDYDPDYTTYDNAIAGGITLRYKTNASSCVAKYTCIDKVGNKNSNNVLKITYELS